MSNKIIVYHNGVPVVVEPLDAMPPQHVVPQQQYYPPPAPYQPPMQYPAPYQPPMQYPAPYNSEAEWCRRPDANGASGVAWKALLIFVLGWVPAFAFQAFGLPWLIWGLGGVWLAFRAGRRG